MKKKFSTCLFVVGAFLSSVPAQAFWGHRRHAKLDLPETKGHLFADDLETADYAVHLSWDCWYHSKDPMRMQRWLSADSCGEGSQTVKVDPDGSFTMPAIYHKHRSSWSQHAAYHRVYVTVSRDSKMSKSLLFGEYLDRLPALTGHYSDGKCKRTYLIEPNLEKALRQLRFNEQNKVRKTTAELLPDWFECGEYEI